MHTSGKVDLMSCIKQILFPAALDSIFGAAFLQHHGSQPLQKAFFAFEEGFELAASPVPHFLQPSFCQGRRALLEAFRISWAEGHFEGTVVGRLLESAPELHSIAPNVLLALLWASLANTVPATYWALAFLLLPDNAHHKQHILSSTQPGGSHSTSHPSPAQQQEVDDASRSRLVGVACDRTSLLAACVAEAVRLRAPGIAVRMAACNLAVPAGHHTTVHVHKGDMLAVSPYESHHDERFFQPHPAGYDPLRGGLQCPGAGLHEVPGVGGIAGLVFGGGRYRCPGRFFAEMEMALTVGFLLTHWDMQLVSCQGKAWQAASTNSPGSSGLQSGEAAAPQKKPSGDPHGLLPLPETRRQVGIRWPQSVCAVLY
ncbi:hypothetical protein ABBQ32_005388 [Trebouxia sp. C0010 RCD-2024]